MNKVFPKYLLIIGIGFLTSIEVKGQVGIHLDKIEIPQVKMVTSAMTTFVQKQIYNGVVNHSFEFLNKYETKTAPIPAAYSYDDLALFCKVEVKIEKAIKKNFKFRLGTLDYVNRLEQKY